MEIDSHAHLGTGVPTRPAERRSVVQASSAPPRPGRPGLRGLLIATALVLASSLAPAQTTGKTVRHHKVEVDDPSSPPELIQAEGAIEKKDYFTAEPLLKKVVADDPQNFAAWFDLGFIYNTLGRTDDAIAAYRKSVAAKPDVFESNLNLGLTLVKAGQPEAEQHLSAGPLLEAQNRYSDAEQEYKQAFALDPSSVDALTGMANIYMRGHRFTDAEEILRKLVTLHPKDAG